MGNAGKENVYWKPWLWGKRYMSGFINVSISIPDEEYYYLNLEPVSVFKMKVRSFGQVCSFL